MEVKMSNKKTPSQQAEELVTAYRLLCKTHNPGMDEERTMFWVKSMLGPLCDMMIKEHTFKNPIAWNKVRKPFWEQVKKEVLNR